MAPTPNAPWTGPSTAEMLQTHTLAHEVIARHDDPCPVFDGAELAYLRDYIANPSTENGTRLLVEHDADNGSLVGHIVGREVRGEVLLDENEKAALRQWYADGKAEERIQAWSDGKGE